MRYELFHKNKLGEIDGTMVINVDGNKYVKSLEDLYYIIEEYAYAREIPITEYYIDFILAQIDIHIYSTHQLVEHNKLDTPQVNYGYNKELFDFSRNFDVTQQLIDYLIEKHGYESLIYSDTRPYFISFANRKDTNRERLSLLLDKKYREERYDWQEIEEFLPKIKLLSRLMISLEEKTIKYILNNYDSVKEFLNNKKLEIAKEENEKIKQYNEKYYEEHENEIKEQRKEYYQKHKETIKERSKIYYEEHKETNREKSKEYCKQYYQKQKAKKAELNPKVEITEDEKIRIAKEKKAERNRKYYEKKKAMTSQTEEK
jgi:hypothetical protein